MLPAGAPDIAIDPSANTVTVSGTFVWDLVRDSAGNTDPSAVFAARSQTPYTLIFPYLGSPFDPDFSPPTDFVNNGLQGPGLAAASVGDLKKATENDFDNTVEWGYYSFDVGFGLDPQGVVFEEYVVTDAGLGPLDASQYYLPLIAFDATYSRITAVGASKYDEYPLIGFDGYTWEQWIGMDTIPGGASVADYREANGLGPGGGGGDDELIDRSDATIAVSESGGRGDDTMLGGSAGDTLSGGTGDDRIDAGRGNDRVTGNAGSDEIDGGRGNDRLKGGGGADSIDGGAGNDRGFGGAGSDDIAGGAGNDRLSGGAGRDLLDGGRGIDEMTGGRGNDTFAFVGNFGTGRITDFDVARDAVSIDEVSTSRAFQRALSDGAGGARYDLDADGANVIVFEGLTVAQLSGIDLNFV